LFIGAEGAKTRDISVHSIQLSIKKNDAVLTHNIGVIFSICNLSTCLAPFFKKIDFYKILKS